MHTAQCQQTPDDKTITAHHRHVNTATIGTDTTRDRLKTLTVNADRRPIPRYLSAVLYTVSFQYRGIVVHSWQNASFVLCGPPYDVTISGSPTGRPGPDNCPDVPRSHVTPQSKSFNDKGLDDGSEMKPGHRSPAFWVRSVVKSLSRIVDC